jgi:alpha-beta hydrolase superfamily lysophospholipase
VVAIGHGVFDDMAVVAKYAQRGRATNRRSAFRYLVATMPFVSRPALPVSPPHRAPAWTGLTPDNVGGVDDFLQVIEKEIKPRVAALVPVNAGNQALFGHSIGGLAVLRALFTEPMRFVPSLRQSRHLVGRRRRPSRRALAAASDRWNGTC